LIAHNRGQADGISLAKLTQLLQPFVSVIFVTGYAVGPVERAMGWPILLKPVCYAMLIAEVNRALGFRTDSRTIRPIEPNAIVDAARREDAPAFRARSDGTLSQPTTSASRRVAGNGGRDTRLLGRSRWRTASCSAGTAAGRMRDDGCGRQPA
jgi:hypothetical protein